MITIYHKSVPYQNLVTNLNKMKDIIFKHRVLAGIFLVAILISLFFGWKIIGSKDKQQEYQTDKATKGTLVVSLAESGQIVSTGNLAVATQTSGIISKVLVKNNDTVTQGQEIMEITPDQSTVQAQTQALADYNSAVNNKTSAQAQLEKDRQAVLDAQVAIDQMNTNISVSKNNPKTGRSSG